MASIRESVQILVAPTGFSIAIHNRRVVMP
jgi:hypothetical protein